MWLNELKIAIVQEDTTKIENLVDNLPTLTTAREIDEAQHLITAATSLLQKLRDNTQASMIQMQKNINFLKSTQAPTTSKLDINS